MIATTFPFSTQPALPEEGLSSEFGQLGYNPSVHPALGIHGYMSLGQVLMVLWRENKGGQVVNYHQGWFYYALEIFP